MERLEIRIDKTTRHLLDDWARSQRISVAEAVRQLIREGLGLPDAAPDKRAAARQLLDIGLTGVPEPEKLEEEIHRAFGN